MHGLLVRKNNPIVQPPLPFSTDGLAGYWDLRNVMPGTQYIPDLSKNNATVVMGLSPLVDTRDPVVSYKQDGLVFNGTRVAIVPQAKTGVISSLSEIVFECIFQWTSISSFSGPFCLGLNMDDSSLHGALQAEANNSRYGWYARRGGDNANLSAFLSFAALPPVGTWWYLLYHASHRHFSIKWIGGSSNNGPVGLYGGQTNAKPLGIGAIYGLPNAPTRMFSGKIRHLAIYNGGNSRFSSTNLFTTAQSQFELFQALGYLDA